MARRRMSDSVPDSHQLVDVPEDSTYPGQRGKHQAPGFFQKYWKLILGIISLLVVIYFMIGNRYQETLNKFTSADLNSALDNTCDKPIFGRPKIQYVLMIDAGSSGSRIHVYRFNYCKETPQIEDEVFHQKQPGLSFYIDDPEKAAKSLDELMDIAVKSVPEELHSCTPVAVKATAGLRLKGPEKSVKVLDAVRKRLEEKYPFKIVDKDGVAIMDGRDEGVYAWITVNYLLGNLNSEAKPKSSVATLDLGGGSIQIVFEPDFKEKEDFKDGDHKYTLDFAGRNHLLYQNSYLGFGLNEARRAIKAQAILDHASELSDQNRVVKHPCLLKGFKEDIISDSNQEITLEGAASNFEECHKLVHKILKKEDACPLFPCSFKGVYQPKLRDTFKTNDIYAFSFFYDRTHPFGLGDRYKLEQVKELAKNVCEGNFDHYKNIPKAKEELLNKPNRCLDLTYIYSLLSTGFDIEDSRTLVSAKKIKDFETGWCLGAAIAVLDGSKYCSAD